MGAVFQPAVAMPCCFGGQGGLSANQAARGPPAFRKAPGTPGSEVPAAGCMGRANTDSEGARACFKFGAMQLRVLPCHRYWVA
jgi:hypothetical protein